MGERCGENPVDPRSPAIGIEAPSEILVAAGGHTLRLRWPHGSERAIAGPRLRAACRCALCLSDARKGRPIMPAPDVTIRIVQPCGANALNIVFSDGHGRGIYPFGYLVALAAQCAVEPA